MAKVAPPPTTTAFPEPDPAPGGNGHGPGPTGAASAPPRPGAPARWIRSRPVRWLVLAALLAAVAAVIVPRLAAGASYPLTAVFPKAPGLFPGAAVEVLGVKVGTVTRVDNVGDSVLVGLQIDGHRAVPAGATASLQTPQLLGEPDIELDPGYTGGPRLAPGATIGESHTAVPVSTDQLLKSLQHTLQAVNPHAVGDLITNLSEDLDHQGQSLNQLIAGAAGTIQLLADKGDDLGRLSGTLAQLTGTLDSRTAQIQQLISDYDTVSSVVAQHSSQLGDAVDQLSGASGQLLALLDPNLTPLEADAGTVTTATRTLDRNLSSVDQIFASATNLFAAAGRAYDPTYRWLNLNLQTAPGVTGAYLEGLVRDRLAGVCRRIAAHHSSGLSAQQLATLASCGNPASGYFDPILNQVQPILTQLNGGPAAPSAAPPTPSGLLTQGLSEIPGASGAARAAAARAAGAPAAPAAPSTTTTTAPPSSSGGSSTCPGGLLGGVLGCRSGSGTSGSKGSGGLLSYRTPVSAPSAPAPSLTAPAARLLPPMPGSGTAPTGVRHHRHHPKAAR